MQSTICIPMVSNEPLHRQWHIMELVHTTCVAPPLEALEVWIKFHNVL